MKPPISGLTLLNLRCGHCRSYVTCGPTHVTPDSSILCGRCYSFAKPIYRNLACEAIGSMFTYPCYYWAKHCNKTLIWNEALEHEDKCLFRSSCNVFCSRPGTFFKSDRKLSPDPETNLEHVTDEVLQELKCVMCECYLSNSPIYILVDGKNICHRCYHANGVPDEAIRNLSYETLASSVIFPCIYRFRGCTMRLKFGREIWRHESECPYGQHFTKMTNKTVKDTKNCKEKGVIETHSGHYWGTITPHSAPFSPPTTKNDDGKILTKELTEIMKKKNDESKNFDAQSMDSIMSRGTFDSIDNVSRSTADNLSRDNISRSTCDNISRSTVDNIPDHISRENVSRSSSRLQTTPTEYSRPSNDTVFSTQNLRPYISDPGYDPQRQSRLQTAYGYDFKEVAPLPTPTGYNKISFNGYYQDNVNRYGPSPDLDLDSHLYHFPPVYTENGLKHSASFTIPTPHSPLIQPQRADSFRVGNINIINELKEKHKKKQMQNVEENQ